MEVVRILEASSESLRQHGASVNLGTTSPWNNGRPNGIKNGHANGNGKSAGKPHAEVVSGTGSQVVAA
jgi:hypothetical protein